MYQSIPTSIIALAGMKFNGLSLNREEKVATIYLNHDGRFGYRCSCCGRPASPNRRQRRQARDLAIFDTVTYLDFEQWQILCPNCGIRIEKLDFIQPKSRSTIRFEESVAYLCRYMTISEVADYFKLDWKTVRAIDKAYLEREFKEPDLSSVRIIGVDEVARCKGHNYLTLVFDLEAGRLIYVGKDRKKESLDAFFTKIGPEGGRRIKAVAMDMWRPYESSVKEHCPQAKIVYDKFHTIQAYNKVIDRIRRQEFAKASEETKEMLKGTKYLLLKNRENLKKDEPLRLEQLLEGNRNLNTAYILKEQLQALWDNPTVAQFNRALIQWCELANESQMPLLKKFAERLLEHQRGLFNYCFYPINTAKIEATNNTIGLIRRNAYGFHDMEYFILKIFQAAG